MRGIGSLVGRWRPAFAVGLTLCGSAGRAVEPNGPAATIGIPVVAMPSALGTTVVVDPFQKEGVMPTPFVPYAARGTDLDPIMRPADAPASIAPTRIVTSPTPVNSVPVTPLPASPAVVDATPPSIDAGSLVPVTLPTASAVSSEPAPKPRPRKSTKTGAAKLEPKIETSTSLESQSTSTELKAAMPAEATTKLMQPESTVTRNNAMLPSSAMTPVRPASISRDVAPTTQPKAPAENRPSYSPNAPTQPWPTNFSFPQPVIPLESALWHLLDVTGNRR